MSRTKKRKAVDAALSEACEASRFPKQIAEVQHFLKSPRRSTYNIVHENTSQMPKPPKMNLVWRIRPYLRVHTRWAMTGSDASKTSRT
eukprot:1435315-Amphidinium_carterae.1